MSIFGEVVLIVYLVGVVIAGYTASFAVDFRKEPGFGWYFVFWCGLLWPVALPWNLYLRRKQQRSKP